METIKNSEKSDIFDKSDLKKHGFLIKIVDVLDFEVIPTAIIEGFSDFLTINDENTIKIILSKDYNIPEKAVKIETYYKQVTSFLDKYMKNDYYYTVDKRKYISTYTSVWYYSFGIYHQTGKSNTPEKDDGTVIEYLGYMYV